MWLALSMSNLRTFDTFTVMTLEAHCVLESSFRYLCRLQEQLGGGEGGFGGLADTLMRQLLAKDVLYQPMKDIGERYPDWLAAHRWLVFLTFLSKVDHVYH